MVKIICDFSFISHYVEVFFSDDNKNANHILQKAVLSKLKRKEKILLIPKHAVDTAMDAFKDRRIVLETIFDVSEIVDIVGSDTKDTLTKLATIIKIIEPNTIILSEDTFHKTSIKDHAVMNCVDLIESKLLDKIN